MTTPVSDTRRYLLQLTALCQALASIGVSQELWDKFAPKSIRSEPNNMICRRWLEDRIRELLRENGDFPNDYTRLDRCADFVGPILGRLLARLDRRQG